MEVRPDAPLILAADLGGTNVRAAVMNRAGKILGSGRAPSHSGEGVDHTITQIVEAAHEAMTDAGVGVDSLAGFGIGVPGHIDPTGGRILWTPNFYEDGTPWTNVSLGPQLEEKLGLKTIMGNDANVAALGEFRFGGGQGTRTMVMFTLGTGIGGGLILDGKLWVGSTGGGGELGHIIVAAGLRGGAAAYGSLESMGQIAAITERAQRKISEGRKTPLADLYEGRWRLLTPKDIADAAEAGDAVAIEVFEETGYYVGLGVASVVNLISPEKVVIGGGVALSGDLILDPIKRTARANGIKTLMDACEIVPATLGDDAGIYGAAGLILDLL
ncbi:MAG: ROK family protein [Armatimonas sp.]